MAATSKVSATSATGIASAPGRVAMGSRFTSVDRIEGLFGSQAPGVRGGWRPGYDDWHGQGGFDHYPQRDEGEHPLFTPLVGRLAGAYPASESAAIGISSAPPLFLTDLLHGIGVYEFNMKVFAGTLTSQGQVINRYS